MMSNVRDGVFTMRWKFCIVFAALCVVLVSAVIPTVPAQADSANAVVPRFEKSACKFEVPAGRTVQCGYLIVPEDRSAPGKRTIRLHVGVFKAAGPKAATDPIVFLDGGPGGHSLEAMTKVRALDFFAQITAGRDLILFDQRGTGYSEPALDCPEYLKALFNDMDQEAGTRQGGREISALQACHDRLVGQGINLGAYTTAANAADVNDLRIALGYAKWNLFGVSYGTRLAQAVMLYYPEGVRSVILDSSMVGLRGYPIFNPLNAFNTLFDGCSRDAACNKAYPSLRSVAVKLVFDLERKPVVVTVTHPITLQRYTMRLTGQNLLQGLFQALYSTKRIPLLPKLIFDARDGSYAGLGQVVFTTVYVQEQYISLGMDLSVRCTEGGFTGLCNRWITNTAKAEDNDRVSSYLPTLILSGQYDPITPPSYSRAVAKTLKQSYYFEFPGIGHGVTFSAQCPVDMTLAFLKNPRQKPDSSCIAKMSEPSFVIRQVSVF
jgi:pimeloyl-ACP methyl ester carboxylesterase